MEFPVPALHREAQSLGFEHHGRLITCKAAYGHKTLLNQSSTNPPGAEALGKKNFLKLHDRHAAIVTASHS